MDSKPVYSKCRSCGAEIFFKVTKKGKAVPLDKKAEMRYIIQGNEAVLVSTYVTHFVTCPNAAQHRKK